MSPLRKILAITLLAFLGLPYAASALSLTPKEDASLPACCRKSGKHHCPMNLQQQAQLMDATHRVAAVPEKCPFAPQAAPASHTPTGLLDRAQTPLIVHVSLTDIVAQAESSRRISQVRTRQTRGPPAITRL